MRSATRRATVAATAVTTVLLLGACSQTAANVAASGGTGTVTAAPSASESTPTAEPVTGDSSSAAPTPPAVPTHSASAAPAAPASAPLLGAVWASGVQGYGTARPSGLNNGGDPTGIVSGLTWSSWGGSSASGTGTAEYVAPGQSVAQGSEEHVTVVAFDLGTCHGRTAYRAVEWYFPGKGQHFSATRYFDACTGQDHGM
jgi:hypothetical protein